LFQLIEENKLSDILQKELEYFQAVYQFSKRFADQIPQLSIHVLTEMLNYRQDLIEKIQGLETMRRELQTDAPGEEAEKLLREISEVATRLVEIDNKISAGLQTKKMDYVRKLSESAVNQHHHQHQVNRGASDGKMFDIIQE
jgi:hypothetical protein